MFELPSSAHSQWNMLLPFPGKCSPSPKGTADLHDSSCSLFWLCFKIVLEKPEQWVKMKNIACLRCLPADLRRGTAQGKGVAGEKPQKGQAAMLSDVLGYYCGHCDSHLKSFVTVWCNFWWCYQVWCIVHALPPFLTFIFAIHGELSNSQKGVTWILKSDGLDPNDGKPREFIRRLK